MSYCSHIGCWNLLPCATHATGLPASMRALTYSAHSEDSKNLPGLEITEVPVPELAADEVLVKISAAACNPVDTMVYNGKIWKIGFPFTMGYDFSGVVAKVGDEVKNLSVGQEVWAVNWGKAKHNDDNPSRQTAGAFAEYIRMPAEKLSLKLPRVSHKTAAALALVGTTAHQTLTFLNVKPGTKLLILGGAAAVGFIAVQLAKLRGCEVSVTCSARSADFVKGFGPDHLIDYTAVKWWECGTVFDAVMDAVGEAGTFAHAKECLRPDGAYASLANGAEVGYDPTAHAPLKASFFCLSNDRAIQDELMSLVEKGSLRVPIDSEFAFTTEGVLGMLHKQNGGKSLGKNVVNI